MPGGFHPGGMQQHPGVPPGHHMAAPGMAHNPSQPGAQPGMPQQMAAHMAASGPGGQVNPAAMMGGGMAPGAGPNAHAMHHLNPQMFQQQQQFACKSPPPPPFSIISCFSSHLAWAFTLYALNIPSRLNPIPSHPIYHLPSPISSHLASFYPLRDSQFHLQSSDLSNEHDHPHSSQQPEHGSPATTTARPTTTTHHGPADGLWKHGSQRHAHEHEYERRPIRRHEK